MRLYWGPSSLMILGSMRNIAAVMNDGAMIVVQILDSKLAHMLIRNGKI